MATVNVNMANVQVVTVELTRKILKQLDHKQSLRPVEVNMLKIIGRLDASLFEYNHTDRLLVQIGQTCYVVHGPFLDELCMNKVHKTFYEIQKIIIVK